MTMPWKATSQSSDSQNQAALGPDDRPDVFITTKGRLAIIPPLDELLKRRGVKGLQACLVDLTHHHFMKHGYDWIYAAGTIKSHGMLYFVHFDSGLTRADVHYLGKYHDAVMFLTNYASTARRNDAMRRAR